MMDVPIERLEIVVIHEGVVPGDDAHFLTVQGAGESGYYGPVSERIGVYARDTLASVVQGSDIADHETLLNRLRTVARTARSDIASWAVGAVDCAVWDLHGRLASCSVADLLSSGQPQRSVAAYASWLSTDLSTCDDRGVLGAVAEDGWRFTKWGLRQRQSGFPGETAVRMAQAVESCADLLGTPVAVDAVGTWTPSLAMAFARSANTSGLLWLEDPLPHHDLDTYALLTATHVPLAVGERARCDEDPTSLMQYVRPTALTLDVVGCGGLTRSLQILSLAQRHGIPVYPHGRSIVPGLHLAADFPDAAPAVEYRLQWEPRRQRMYDVPLWPEQGCVRLPDIPGLGTTPRSKTCHAHQ